MHQTGNIRLRQPGKLAKTTYVNEVAQSVNAILGPGNFPNVPPEARVYAWFHGKTVTAGPNGEADFTDERYWVQVEYLESGPTSDNITRSDDKSDPDFTIIPATNLSETDSGGTPGLGAHGLTVGTPVVVLTLEDIGSDTDPAQPHYVFIPGGASLPRGQYGGEVFQTGPDGVGVFQFLHGTMLNPSGTNGT